MNEELADKYWEVRFRAKTQEIYYSRRVLFWTGLEMFAQLGEFILSTSAFLALTRDHATFGTWATFTVSILSFLTLWLGAGKRARRCAELNRDFGALVGEVPPFYDKQTEAGAEAAYNKLRELENRESVAIPCAGMLSYLDACFGFGAKPQWRLNWMERTIGRFLPIPYTPKAAE